jgi:hypothetical protein
MRTFIPIVGALALTACSTITGGDDDGGDDTPLGDQIVMLSPTDHLVRASMTIRGTRPSRAELDQVAADPDALPGIVDAYLASPGFGTVMRDVHSETLLTRVEIANQTIAAIGALAGTTVAEMNGSIYEEPLKLIEHVIVNDRPYSEIVTADYTLANKVVASVWGLPYDDAGPEWQVTTYEDTRPDAGILSSSAIYFRHRSAGFNYHRGRANLISSALLCHDYLEADIMVDTTIDLSDPEIVADAVRANPACAACHQTLDPLGSFLFGYRNQVGVQTITSYPVPMYIPANADNWENATERPPGFFGQPGDALDDLGRFVAGDPRFARCAAQRFASYFTQTDKAELSYDWIARLTDEFVASGLDAKALVKAIVLSDEFRVSHTTPDAAIEVAEATVGLLKARPETIDSMITDLTGFQYRHDSPRTLRRNLNDGTSVDMLFGMTDLLRSDWIGYRAIVGGIDSYFVTQPVHTTNVPSSLMLQQLAAQAAGFVVDADFGVPAAQRRLLSLVEPADVDETKIRAQLSDLHARIYGALDAPDSEAVTETYGLFSATLALGGDVRRAWKTTLTAMLGDLRVAYF